MNDRQPVLRALVSVYDKTGLEPFAKGLAAAGVEIVSTGSTAARIADAGVAVTKVEEVTEFPECLDGRVKTLHPRIHAGILADRRLESHVAELEAMGIAPFDLVVSNLYPFAETVRSGAAPDEVIEQIDIGGPSMVRAAAKNHPSVAVIVNPAEYDAALAAIAAGGFTLAERQALAVEAFRHTATYDIHVASWMGNVVSADDEGTGFPGWVGMSATRRASLRYGENPHQAAALYVDEAAEGGIANAEQLHGKEMSYNNYVDADAAWRAAHDHDGVAVAVVKHANPCGIAVGTDVADAHSKAHACDPVSAYGGVIASNREVTAAAARQIAEIFTEVIAAPSYEAEALEILQAKKNLRILVVEGGRGAGRVSPDFGWAPLAAGRSNRRRRRRAVNVDPRGRARRDARGARRPGVRLALVPLHQVKRDPPRQGRRLRRRGHGSGQPRRLVPPCRRASGGGASEGLRRGVGRLLPVRRRLPDPRRCGRDRRRRAGRVDSGCRGDRRRGRGRGLPLLHRHSPLLPLGPMNTAPRPLVWLPLLAVAVGIVILVDTTVVAGMWVLAGLALGAAASRAIGWGGAMLRVRRRAVDASILAAFAALLAFLAGSGVLG